MENNSMASRVKHLERKILYLTGLCALLVVATLLMAVSTFTQKVNAAEDAKVLRLKGLIIEDAQGRARILLGAPFPSVSDRLRQDVTGTAMVFLDEKGHDRFSLGEMMPASPGFHRIGSAYGLNIYDPEGNERGGMGFLSNGSSVSRAAIVLDRPSLPSTSGDAWGAMVDDKTGFAGTGYMYSPEVGHGKDGLIIGTEGHKAFITFKDLNNKPRSTFALSTDGTPSFQLFDDTGKPGPDFLNPLKSESTTKH
jgi:hypothetical protein